MLDRATIVLTCIVPSEFIMLIRHRVIVQLDAVQVLDCLELLLLQAKFNSLCDHLLDHNWL